MKPPFSGPRVHFYLLCSAYKAQGCWFIEAWAAFGWTKSLGDIASRQREATARIKAQRQEYAGHVLGASWWGWGWGFRSRSWRYKESCRGRPGLCGYKWQKIQLLLAELRRKCISSSESRSAQGSPLWTRVRRGPDLKGKMLTRPKEKKNKQIFTRVSTDGELSCIWHCCKPSTRTISFIFLTTLCVDIIMSSL